MCLLRPRCVRTRPVLWLACVDRRRQHAQQHSAPDGRRPDQQGPRPALCRQGAVWCGVLVACGHAPLSVVFCSFLCVTSCTPSALAFFASCWSRFHLRLPSIFAQLSGVFVPIVVALALFTFFLWFGLAANGMKRFLLISSPCLLNPPASAVLCSRASLRPS